MTVKVITQEEYLKLLGLRELIKENIKTMKSLESAVLSITKETNSKGELEEVWNGSCSGDFCFDPDMTTETLLKNLKIEILK